MRDTHAALRDPPRLRSLALAVLLLGLGAGAQAWLPHAGSVISSPASDADRNRINDALDRALVDLPEEAPNWVIVVMKDAPSATKMRTLQEILGSFPVTSAKEKPWDGQGRPWTVLPAFSATLTKVQVLQLARDPDIREIHGWVDVRLHLDTATVATGVQAARPAFNAFGDQEDVAPGFSKSYSKEDPTICVVDTGIDATHVDLNDGQVIGFKDFVNGRDGPANAYDDNDHGTWAASIAAGQGDADQGGVAANRGVAPGASLVGVKVFNAGAVPPPVPGDPNPFAMVINGINWCTENKATYGIDILSLSFGGLSCARDDADPMSLAAEGAVDAGLIVVASAGNYGPATCSVEPPASAPRVIAVGMVGDPRNACDGPPPDGGWYLGVLSARGPAFDGRFKPDLVAPGVCVTGADGDAISHTQYKDGTGTSASAPFVAGVAALLLDAQPGLTTAQVKDILLSSAQDWGASLREEEPKNYDYGAGLLRAYEAVQQACGGCQGSPGPPAQPTHFFRPQALGSTPGATDAYEFVSAGQWPIAAVMLLPQGAQYDFDLVLRRGDGTILDASTGVLRQETVTWVEALAGTYRLEVTRIAGSGDYWLDISADVASEGLSLIQDQ